MTYSPTQATIRQRIIDNLKSTLEGMSTPTFATEFASVKVWGGNVALAISEYPSAIIMPMGDESDDSRSAILEHTLDLAIMLVVDDSDWASALERAIAEVQVALLTDWQRGGVALDTKVLSSTPWDDEATEPKAGAQMLVRVIYRTLYEDPTVAV